MSKGERHIYRYQKGQGIADHWANTLFQSIRIDNGYIEGLTPAPEFTPLLVLIHRRGPRK